MGTTITSLLDIDFYKFTMGQLVFHRYPDVSVKHAFLDRGGSPIASLVPEGRLRDELDHAATLRLNNSELHYLRGTNEYGDRMFREDYLEFLRGLRLPPYELRAAPDGRYEIDFEGKWAEAIYWETICLAIVNQLYFEAKLAGMSRLARDSAEAVGRLSLAAKAAVLKQRPDITFVDFGTRRRFSRAWQEYVVQVMAEELPGQFLGTSNTDLAMRYGLLPMGTSAHEMFMVMAGLNDMSPEALRSSHNLTLRDWWDEYGWGLSVALTDTFTSDFFFRDMTPEQAAAWKGLRQDSGDPFAFGEKAIAFYERVGVDPKEKTIIFSDGLTLDRIVELTDRFAGRIRVTFGWGTDLTNSMGMDALQIVVKAVEANGRPLVKLTDDPHKAIGSPADIERYRRAFSSR